MSVSLSRLENFYGDLGPQALLHAMTQQEFPGKIALLTSFGADAAVMLSLVAEVDPSTPVLFLETHKHFPETLTYAKELTALLGLTDVRWLKPDPVLTARIDANGDLWKTQPNRCCWLRKVEPLERAVKEMGFEALITGRKRYQTSERANLRTIELAEDKTFRINPIANWSREDSKAAFAARNLPEHPLVSKGYKSIGCAPCTSPVDKDGDERAGRWAHTIGFENEQKTECGIHMPSSETNWSV